MDLRAVDRDHPDLRQPRPGAQPQDVAEQSGERCLVALAKTRNRNAGPSRRRRATARPSPPGRAPDGHDHRDGRRRRTPTNPSPQQPPTRTTRDGPPAATCADSAASTTPARGHSQRSSEPCTNRPRRPGRTPGFTRPRRGAITSAHPRSLVASGQWRQSRRCPLSATCRQGVEPLRRWRRQPAATDNRRALATGNPTIATAAALELPRVRLEDAHASWSADHPEQPKAETIRSATRSPS